MALSKQTIAEIESFAIDSDSNLGMSFMKQPTDKRAAHLVISLGGSGADMLREVKGLIGQNCCSDDDRHKAPERVAYVAFDTDVSEKEKRSGRETGQAALEEDEITILAGEAAGVGFAHLTQEAYPWIYRWLDPEILHMAPPYNESGAGGVRQVGRLLLFLDLERVVEKLRSAITDLAKRTGVESITIHILSGISGGTGSGMFLDMAYIVRQVAEEIIGAGAFRCTRIRMIAYLLMPDVNLRRALEQSKPMLMRNAGAALQELDHAMRLGEIGEYYECRYSAAMSVKTDRRPFDYVYLISAGPKDEDTPEESYRHSLRVVAEHILTMVSGQYGEENFFLHSVFSNLGVLQSKASVINCYKERSACYLSLGYECLEIAADKLTRYIFTNLFEKVGDLVGNEPEQEDVYNLLDSLGLGCDRMMMELLQEMALPLNPREYTGRQLFGKDAVDMTQVMSFIDESRVINNIFSGLSSAFEDRLREEAANAFMDIDRGPVWASHVLVSETSARFNALDRLITEEKNKAIQYREAAQQAAEDFLYSINKMREDRRPRFLTVHDSKKCAEYINAWNNYFRTSMEVYCYDLLIGREDTLESIGRWGTLGFYDDARNKVEKLRDRWLSDASRVLEEVSRVVRRNTDEFRSVSAANETHGFIWSTGDIPNPEEAVNVLISENGIDRANIIRRFLEKLFDNIDDPSQIGNFREFMEEFLQQYAQGVFDASPEDLLRSSFDDPESLAKSVERDLLPYMNRNAKPRFDWEGNTSCYRRILMIPGGCEHIEKGAREYIGGQSDIGLKVWNLRGRISMGVILANLSLHNYFLYQECERQICLDPNARGIFLNQGSESYPGAVNNMKDRLPSVIPSRKRTAQEPAPKPIEKFERDLVMELREMRKGEYPFLHFEKTSDEQDFILYINLSASLDQSGFYDMTGEENYQTAAGEPDADKLKELIERLKEIRYKTGLPETAGLPKRLIVCEKILSSATQEMKDRYLDLLPDQEEAVKEEVAWEVAEWYYVSAYSFYMKAREEKAKYDEIEEKIRELEGILEEFEVKKAVKEEPVYEAEPEVRSEEEPVVEEGPVYEAEPEVKLDEEPEAEEEPVYEAEPEVKLTEEPVEEPEVVLMAEEEPVYEAEPEVKLAEEPVEELGVEEEPAYEAEPEVKTDEEPEVEPMAEEEPVHEAKTEVKLAEEPVEEPEVEEEPVYEAEPEVKTDEEPEVEPMAEEEPVYEAKTEVKLAEEPVEEPEVEEEPVYEAEPKIEPKEEPEVKEEPVYEAKPEAGAEEDPEAEPIAEEKPVYEAELEVKLAEEPEEEPMVEEKPVYEVEPKVEPEEEPEVEEEPAYEAEPEVRYVVEQKPAYQAAPAEKRLAGWTCSKGHSGNQGNFCTICGEKKPDEGWTCPQCGRKGNQGNFCTSCGKKKPEEEWICPQCGKRGNTGNFCTICGFRKPVKIAMPPSGWICTNCGQKENKGNFCIRCGARKL